MDDAGVSRRHAALTVEGGEGDDRGPRVHQWHAGERRRTRPRVVGWSQATKCAWVQPQSASRACRSARRRLPRRSARRLLRRFRRCAGTCRDPGTPTASSPARTGRAGGRPREPRAARCGRRDQLRHRLDRNRPVAGGAARGHGGRARRRRQAVADPRAGAGIPSRWAGPRGIATGPAPPAPVGTGNGRGETSRARARGRPRRGAPHRRRRHRDRLRRRDGDGIHHREPDRTRPPRRRSRECGLAGRDDHGAERRAHAGLHARRDHGGERARRHDHPSRVQQRDPDRRRRHDPRRGPFRSSWNQTIAPGQTRSGVLVFPGHLGIGETTASLAFATVFEQGFDGPTSIVVDGLVLAPLDG